MCKHENGSEISNYWYKTILGKMVWLSELCGKSVVTHWKEIKKMESEK